MEIIFPMWLLLRCLDRFGAESRHTRVDLIESVLGDQADLAIAPPRKDEPR